AEVSTLKSNIKQQIVKVKPTSMEVILTYTYKTSNKNSIMTEVENINFSYKKNFRENENTSNIEENKQAIIRTTLLNNKYRVLDYSLEKQVTEKTNKDSKTK
ncbi:13075_t:CDS:2, partial [Dentiscutata heterogama]